VFLALHIVTSMQN